MTTISDLTDIASALPDPEATFDNGDELEVAIESWMPYCERFLASVTKEELAGLCADDTGIASFVKRVGGQINPQTGEIVKNPLDPENAYWLLGSIQMTCQTWKDKRIGRDDFERAIRLGVARKMHSRRTAQKIENCAAWASLAAILEDDGLAKVIETLTERADKMLADELKQIEAGEKARAAEAQASFTG